MRVLITGATGFIGKKICRRLFEANHEIVVLSRNAKKANETLSQYAAKSYHWNPDQKEISADALKDIDAVIHLAGESVASKRWSPKQKEKIKTSRVDATRFLIHSLKAFSLPKVFVSASALGFYGDRDEEELTEASLPGQDFLAKTCQAWENEVHQISSECRTVMIRVGLVLGHDGGMLKRILPIFRFGLGGKLGSGKQWMSWIHCDDLADLFMYALSSETVFGPVNGSAPNPVRNSEFTKKLAKACRRPAIFPVPALILKLILGDLSILMLGSQKMTPQSALQSGFSFQYPNLSEALNNLLFEK